MITFRIPVGPSVNAMFTTGWGKRGRGLSQEYRDWRDVARHVVTRQWAQQGKPLPSKPWGCTITVGVNRRGDIMNREKAITDLLVKTIPGWPDDAWLDVCTVRRGCDAGFCDVEVYSVE